MNIIYSLTVLMIVCGALAFRLPTWFSINIDEQGAIKEAPAMIPDQEDTPLNLEEMFPTTSTSSDHCGYSLLQEGACNSTQSSDIQTAAESSCLDNSDIGDFVLQLQSGVQQYGFSAIATYNTSDLGFMICLGSELCYSIFSVGPYQAVIVFEGASCYGQTGRFSQGRLSFPRQRGSV